VIGGQQRPLIWPVLEAKSDVDHRQRNSSIREMLKMQTPHNRAIGRIAIKSEVLLSIKV
jgi:hypothetical protein